MQEKGSSSNQSLLPVLEGWPGAAWCPCGVHAWSVTPVNITPQKAHDTPKIKQSMKRT